MGEISDLRAQILDNIKTLHPDFQTDSRFVLTCNVEDGSEEWAVILGRPMLGDEFFVYLDTYGKGTGGTPEDAYKDLLKQTALELDTRGYTQMMAYSYKHHPIRQ